MSAPYERDLAHEADMRELRREQLRNDVEDECIDVYDGYSVTYFELVTL